LNPGVRFIPPWTEGLWTPPHTQGPRFDNIPSDPASVLLIGCGAVGSVVAHHLASSEVIADVVLADVDADLAKKTASRLRRPNVRAMQLDASDPRALAEATRGCRLVINTALPRFNRGIQEVALEAGLDYLDPANDMDPFASADRWVDQGRTAICGMGEDPGLSNVFARYAADGMDRVDSIKVRDGDTASSPEHPFIALFSPETFIEETLASSRIWTDGRYETVPPFGAFETYEFPPPLGPLPVYSVDHEEVDTLPGFIGKGVRYVDFKLALDATTVQTLKLFRDLRLLERGPPGGPSPRKALFAALPKPVDLAGHVDGFAAVLVEVTGEKDGHRVTHSLYSILGHREASERFGATATAYLTGTGAAVGAILLASGVIKKPGMFSPEQLDPKLFFPLLKEWGIEVRERITQERDLA